MEIKGDDSIVNVDVTIDKKTRFLKIEVVGFGIIPDQLQGWWTSCLDLYR